MYPMKYLGENYTVSFILFSLSLTYSTSNIRILDWSLHCKVIKKGKINNIRSMVEIKCSFPSSNVFSHLWFSISSSLR